MPGNASRLQAKLRIGSANDAYEQEADRVADQVMRTPSPADTLQRKCAACEEEEKLQRKENGSQSASTTAPPVVDAVLSGNGSPLDSTVRTFMEPRFGHDFGDVRIHTDRRAAESARSVNALAYTVGRDVVFGAGTYQPGTESGRRLIAHELTHVVQQGRGGGGIVQRKKGEFDTRTLLDYLQRLRDTGTIEGTSEEGTSKSDNKARDVVRRWRRAEAGFELTPDIKILLIKEMLDGPTLDADEGGIIDLLRFSEDGDLRIIFGPGGLKAADINDDVHGGEWKRLRAWYEVRFKGGLQAVLAGGINPQGGPEVAAPVFPYSKASLMRRLNDSRYTAAEVNAYVQTLPAAERDAAIKDLLDERKRLRPLQEDAADNGRGAEAARHLAAITRIENVLNLYYPDKKGRSATARKKTTDWQAADPSANLTAADKLALIKELMYGFSRDEDESAILDILEGSENGDLRIIFGAGGLNPGDFYLHFIGKQKKRLNAFIAARYDGMIADFALGLKDFKGRPGVGAPVFPYDWAQLKKQLEDPAYRAAELYPTLASRPEAEREQAMADLARERVAAQKLLVDFIDQKKPDPVLKKQRLIVVKIDELFQYLYKDVALAEPQAVLLGKTKTLTAAEKSEAKDVLKPALKVDPVLGVVPPFTDPVKYEADLRAELIDIINKTHASMVVGKGAVEHADPTKVHSLKRFEEIGKEAKRWTDQVFGSYKTGRGFVADTSRRRGNIHDLWADMDKEIRGMSAGDKKGLAKALVFYFFQARSSVKAINRTYNADPKFSGSGAPLNDEAKVQEKLAKEFSRTDTRRLNEIDRGWPATANPATGDINFQIFKEPIPDDDRRLLWDVFQTFIHEYLHTLVHKNYRKYADSFGHNSNQNNTLMEGVDSFLTEIVWAHVRPSTSDPALRAIVEGPVYSALPYDESLVPMIFSQRYGSYNEAARLVEVVGVRNLYAAYFLGKTELIGA